MIKLLHTADLHLDSPFSGLPPEEAAARRAAQRRLAVSICRLADRRGCQLLFFAGDVFDSQRPYPETLEALSAAFAACRAHIFIAPGNHDYWSRGGPWDRAWPGNVHIFRSESIEAVPLPELNTTVFGAAFTGSEARSLLEGFHTDAPNALALLHGDAEQRESMYNPVTPAQVAASGLCYLALGHIHSRSGLRRAGQTYFAWPGCPEGRGFDECGPKGVFEVTVDDGVQAVFLPLKGVRYEVRSVDISEGEPAERIAEALPPSPALHARVTLTGGKAVDTAALVRHLEGQYGSLELIDCTAAPPDLWQPVDPNTLRGLFLQELRARWEGADPADRAEIELAARLGLAALEGREVQGL